MDSIFLAPLAFYASSFEPLKYFLLLLFRCRRTGIVWKKCLPILLFHVFRQSILMFLLAINFSLAVLHDSQVIPCSWPCFPLARNTKDSRKIMSSEASRYRSYLSRLMFLMIKENTLLNLLNGVSSVLSSTVETRHLASNAFSRIRRKRWVLPASYKLLT